MVILNPNMVINDNVTCIRYLYKKSKTECVYKNIANDIE